MKDRNKPRGGAAVRTALLVFVLISMAGSALTMFSGCGAGTDAGADSAPPVTESTPEATVPAAPTPQPTEPPDPSPSPTPEVTEPPADNTGTAAQTAADVGAGLAVTVPESAPVGDEYFADAVFVGDSRTEGLKMYSGLTGTSFFSSVGMAVDKVFTDRVVSLNGQYLTVAEALQQADYSKVYIMLGLNELGWVYESKFAEDYGRIIDVIRESHPDATIYVQSIIPVSAWKDGSSDIYTNANVVRLQKALCDMCVEKGVNYVNVAEAMQDAGGFLPSDATPDGVHLTPEYCQIWMDYLKTHTVQA